MTASRRRDKRIWYLLLGVFVAVFLFSFLAQKFNKVEEDVDAASLANFDPGNIISDYQMSNYKSMTEAQIQSFLKSKNSCNDRDMNKYVSGKKISTYSETYPPYTWHVKDGRFVCMADEKIKSETAAHIIYQTAQDYRINPQVLIVLLQKEQGLVTDTFPNSFQYRSATGYGCPDTAACSTKYYGFKNQVRNAAAMFRTVLDGGWTNYPVGKNYIQYSPNAACGGSIVNIKNRATSALYRYTPYQPNKAALAAGYGTANCGAYGNRNFYLYFQDWFGGITASYSTKIGRAIPDGTYQIVIDNSRNEAVDIYGGIRNGMKSEKLITFGKKSNNKENQIFEVKYNTTSGYYNVYNPTTMLYITAEGNSVFVKEKDGSCGQNWNLKMSSVGSYNLISACDGRNIGISSDKNLIMNGNNVVWRLYEISGKTNKLKDGIYQISTALSNNYVLDVKGSVNVYKTSGEINLWGRKGSTIDRTNQVFKIQYNKDSGYYYITNALSGLALDVSGAKRVNSTKVGMWVKNNGCNQQWMIKEVDGGYEIISACSGLKLDIPKSNVVAGQNLIIFEGQNAKNQKWKFESVIDTEEDFNGSYVIASRADPQEVFDVKGGIDKTKKTGEIITYVRKITNNSNQVFKFKKVENENAYYIYNPESNLYLDVSGASSANSAKIILWKFNGQCNQKWKIAKDKEGYYSIASACSNKLIDVSGGKVTNSKPIIIFPNLNGFNQKWMLFRFAGT